MSQTPDNQSTRSTPITVETPLTPQLLPSPSDDKEYDERPIQKLLLLFQYREVVLEHSIKLLFDSNHELIKKVSHRDISNQTSEEKISNAFSQTSDSSFNLSSNNTVLTKKESQISKKSVRSQAVTTQQPIVSNVASLGSIARPIDPKTAEYDAKQTQYYQQPHGQYQQYPQQGYAPQQQYAPQYQQQYAPQYQQGYQQGYPPPQQQQRGMGAGLKNMVCLGSCMACLMLLCTSCCQAAAGSAGGADYGDDGQDDDY